MSKAAFVLPFSAGFLTFLRLATMTLFTCQGCTNLYNRNNNRDLCAKCITIPSVRLALGRTSNYRGDNPGTDTPIDPRTVDERQLKTAGWYKAHPTFNRSDDWTPNPIPGQHDSSISRVVEPKRSVDSPTMSKPLSKRHRGNDEHTPISQYSEIPKAPKTGQDPTFPIPHVYADKPNELGHPVVPGIRELMKRWPAIVVDDLPHHAKEYDCESIFELAGSLLETYLGTGNKRDAVKDFTVKSDRPFSELADGTVLCTFHGSAMFTQPHHPIRRVALYPLQRMLAHAAGMIQVPIYKDDSASLRSDKEALRGRIKCEPFLFYQVDNAVFPMPPRAFAAEASDIHALFCIKEGSPWPFIYNATEFSERTSTIIESTHDYLELPVTKKHDLEGGKNKFDMSAYLEKKNGDEYQDKFTKSLESITVQPWGDVHKKATDAKPPGNTALKEGMRVGQMIILRGNTSFYLPKTDVTGKYVLFRLVNVKDDLRELMPFEVPRELVEIPDRPFTKLVQIFANIRAFYKKKKKAYNMTLQKGGDGLACLNETLKNLKPYLDQLIGGHANPTTDQKKLFVDAIFWHHGMGISRRESLKLWPKKAVVDDGKTGQGANDGKGEQGADDGKGGQGANGGKGGKETNGDKVQTLKAIFEKWRDDYVSKNASPAEPDDNWGMVVDFSRGADGRMSI